MPGEPAYVIVGASLAGAKAAETLREEGFGGAIALVGEETERPYERPPLSKGFLLGKAAKSSIYVHEEAWYAAHRVNLLLGTAVTAIDRTGGRMARRSPTTGCFSPPAPRRARWMYRAVIWAASGTSARWRTRSGWEPRW